MAVARSSQPTLFIRQATGLVRAWSVFDAFVYAFFSINLVTLGLYIFSQMYFFEGSIATAVIVSSLIIVLEVVVYASLIAVMPRAGGDYVWQSRILGGGIGFVLAVTGWWFILWYWVPLYGDMLRFEVLTPILALLGARDSALWFTTTPAGSFLSSVLVIVIVSIFIALGMRTYARIQRFCFYVGMAGLLSVFALLAFSSNDAFRAGLNALAPTLFGAENIDLYAETIRQAQAQEVALGGYAPLAFTGVVAMIPYIVFFNLWPNWGSTLYGEVKGASDFTRNFKGMFYALGAAALLALIFFALIAKTIGWEFYTAANATFWNHAWGYSEQPSPLGVWPYPALLASFVTTNPIVHIWVVLSMSLWWFGWAGTVFLSSTRVIFAAAFDRVLPEWVADINPRFRTPLNALMLMTIPSLVVSYLFAYDVFGFKSLTLTSTLVITVTFLGTSIAATILPYRKPDLYAASPIAKYNIGGIPMITVAGGLLSLFFIFLLYQWMVDPNALYGIGLSNTNSVIFMLFMYLLALAIYLGSRYYRSQQGMSLDMVYNEIPVE